MFKLDTMAIAKALYETGPQLVGTAYEYEDDANCASREIARQIKDAGGPDGSLEEQLRALIASHKALAEAGEEMPSETHVVVALKGESWVEDARSVMALFLPTIARLRRERDEARTVARMRRPEQPMPNVEDDRRTTYMVNVDTSEAQAKLETLLTSVREYEAALDRALAKTQALASCSSPANIGIGDPPPKPPPPPPSALDICGAQGPEGFAGACILEKGHTCMHADSTPRRWR